MLLSDGYMSSPERGTRSYEEPYYSQYGTRAANATPIIDEEQKYVEKYLFIFFFFINKLIFFRFH